MANKGFCLFYDWVDALNELKPEEAWAVVQAVSAYHATGADPVAAVPKHLRALVKVMFQQIKRAEEVSDVRSKAGKASAEARSAEVCLNDVQQKSTTETDTDTDTKTDTSFTSPCGDDKKRARKNAKKFVPPTLEEVTEYCRSRNSPVDPKKFYEYFSEGGWKDAKGNPVHNWKQKVITWEKYDEPKGKPPDQPERTSSFDTDEFMLDALKRTYGSSV